MHAARVTLEWQRSCSTHAKPIHIEKHCLSTAVILYFFWVFPCRVLPLSLFTCSRPHFFKTATCDNAAMQRLAAEGFQVLHHTVVFNFRIHIGFLLTQQ
jgi:hypothetical protein